MTNKIVAEIEKIASDIESKVSPPQVQAQVILPVTAQVATTGIVAEPVPNTVPVQEPANNRNPTITVNEVPPFKKVCDTEGCARIYGHVLPHSNLNGVDWA